jgi:hypothetical protein
MTSRSLLLTGFALLAACNDGASDAASRNDIRTASEYAALPSAVFEADRPLCADALACLPPTQAVAAVHADGDVLTLVLSGRRAEVVRVQAGTDVPVPVGREGSGPGEYRIPGLLDFSPAGEALVFDIMARRTLRFGRDGTPLATSVVLLPASPHPAFGFVGGGLRILGADTPPVPGDSMPTIVFALDSGALEPRRLQTLAFKLPTFPIGELRIAPRLFVPGDFFALRADSTVVFANGGQLGVDIFTPTGGLRRRIGFTLASRAPSAEEIAEEANRRVRGIPDPQARAAIAAELRENAAAKLPVLTGIVAMGDGELWLRGSPSADGSSVEWLVLTAEGEPLRRVRTATEDAILGKHGARYLVARAEEEGSRFWWMTLR